MACCQRVHVDPFAWFKDVLACIASHPISRIAELLPHNWASTRIISKEECAGRLWDTH
ncbi:MAG: transposase domain-containing protein [Bryobacteraceae bacterium]